MTAVATTRPGRLAPTTTRTLPAARTSFVRQSLVEARKLVDTRSGRWVAAAGVLLTGLAVPASVYFGLEAIRMGATGFVVDWAFAATSAGTALGMFLAILGILTVTNEWTQRTALTTFALEPRRGRVLAAKAVVLVMASLALVALSVGVGAAAIGVAQALGADVAWTFPAAKLGGFTAVTLLNTAFGFALGVLLQHSAGAIVAFFVVPVVWNLLVSVAAFWTNLADLVPWVTPTASQLALADATISGAQWGQLATTTALWIALPAVIGTVRWLRRQVA